MMKRALLVLMFFAAAAAQAKDSLNLLCITEIPTTSFAFHEDGDNLRVEVLHHNGVQYMPIFEGVLTPNDLKQQSDNAQVLMSLGDHIEFLWPKSKCSKQARFLQNCFGTLPELKIAGHSVKAWSVYSAKETSQSYMGTFEQTSVTLALEVDGKNYYIPMRYFPGDCVDDATAIKKGLQRLK